MDCHRRLFSPRFTAITGALIAAALALAGCGSPSATAHSARAGSPSPTLAAATPTPSAPAARCSDSDLGSGYAISCLDTADAIAAPTDFAVTTHRYAVTDDAGLSADVGTLAADGTLIGYRAPPMAGDAYAKAIAKVGVLSPTGLALFPAPAGAVKRPTFAYAFSRQGKQAAWTESERGKSDYRDWTIKAFDSAHTRVLATSAQVTGADLQIAAFVPAPVISRDWVFWAAAPGEKTKHACASCLMGAPIDGSTKAAVLSDDEVDAVASLGDGGIVTLGVSDLGTYQVSLRGADGTTSTLFNGHGGQPIGTSLAADDGLVAWAFVGDDTAGEMPATAPVPGQVDAGAAQIHVLDLQAKRLTLIQTHALSARVHVADGVVAWGSDGDADPSSYVASTSSGRIVRVAEWDGGPDAATAGNTIAWTHGAAGPRYEIVTATFDAAALNR